ncbi:MAG: succinate dehydrogenase hydrophobic membrane anchor subunit [Isosphaeraceae bacterium]|nr:succinate dehydrogenase hydrophobic membrane anchor subunit [Isosphaeraceae bacterium]
MSTRAAQFGGRKVRPAGGFELTAWFFMRISGLLLVFLALGHLFITHILNNVESINYAFVASRWAHPKHGYIWRLWDLTMICLAVIHGFNGLRQVLDEYVVHPGRRVIAHTLIWSACIFLLGLGSYAILQFKADQEYIDKWKAEHHVASATAPIETGASVLAGD